MRPATHPQASSSRGRVGYAAIVCFSSADVSSAFAQGITNPAGGGVIPVLAHLVLGYGLLAYVYLSIAAKHTTGKVRALPVMVPVIALYVALGLVLTYVPERNQSVLHLYLVLLALIAGTLWLTMRTPARRAVAIASAAAFVVALNVFRPKLFDLQTRSYFDNTDDLSPIAVSYPGHWREMHLEDGRVLLNINPHRKFGGTLRMIADQNKIASPISLGETAQDDRRVLFTVYTPEATRGTWGWEDRPNPLFRLPLLGTAHILRFENRLAGTALLLDADGGVDCRYLYEARGEPVPEAAIGKRVVWTTERRVDSGSVVACE